MQDKSYKKIIDKIWEKRDALGITRADISNPKNWMK